MKCANMKCATLNMKFLTVVAALLLMLTLVRSYAGILWRESATQLDDDMRRSMIELLRRVEPQPLQNNNPDEQVQNEFLELMAGRVANVTAVCSAGGSKVSYKNVLDYIVADPQESLLFCPVYKAASSMWLIAMLQMRGVWGPDHTAIDINLLKKQTFKKYKVFNPLKQYDAFKTRFIVTRHPLERLLSCYRDKYENANKAFYYNRIGKKMLRMYRERPADMSSTEVNNLLAKVDDDMERERTLGNIFANPVGPTFTEYIKYVVSSYADDEHWRPYHVHCAPCSINYNFILRFEDMAEEGDKFLTYIDAPTEIQPKKMNVFKGLPTVDVYCSYYSQLNIELFAKLVKKYDVDMQMFGYNADTFFKCADEYVKQ